jgi:hypothetical protein
MNIQRLVGLLKKSHESTSIKIAGGYGVGTLTCPNKLVLNNEQIQFQVNKSKSVGVASNEQGTSKS